MNSYRLTLNLPDGFQSKQLDSNWSDMFMGLPRDSVWEVEAENDEELGWLLADFLAFHSGIICEAAKVSDFQDIEDPGSYVQITEIQE